MTNRRGSDGVESGSGVGPDSGTTRVSCLRTMGAAGTVVDVVPKTTVISTTGDPTPITRASDRVDTVQGPV